MNRTDRYPTDEPTDTRPTDAESTDEPTMRDVSHTHPHTARGAVNRPFERGPVVAADGGERGEREETSESERGEADAENGDREGEQMRDVDHTPPHGDGANRVFERGKEESVESEE